MKRTSPLRIGVAASLTVMALLAGTAVAGEAAEKKSGIKGKIYMEGTQDPVEKAYVYAYVGRIESRAAALGIIGITDWVSHGSTADGTFSLDVPPGQYYVVARKRSSGANYGPLSHGDLYDHSQAKKLVTVKKGKYSECDFYLRELAEPLFFQGLTARDKVTQTGIRGRLLDEKGDHVAGTFVIAFTDDDMKRLPDFASTLTDDDGNYTLYLPKGGKYYLAARFYAMKVPEKGEPFGRYEGTEDHSVEVADGSFVEGVDITLRPYRGEPPKDYSPLR